jgi:hypothetical protein
VTDIFFSYRSVDRERVRPIRDVLVAQGFEVFWDQEIPSGVDWDTWIRQHLGKAKCVVVFWSAASVESDNVRHEATVAKRQGKLIAVLLESLTPDQFPMGLYTQQAINLANWNGDFDHEWNKLKRDIEAKLTPPWLQQKVYELEAELVAEHARREGFENRERALQAQIAKEVTAHDDLKRERNQAVDDAMTLRKTVDDLSRALSQTTPDSPSESKVVSKRPRAADSSVQRASKLVGSMLPTKNKLGHWIAASLAVVTAIALISYVAERDIAVLDPSSENTEVPTAASAPKEPPSADAGFMIRKNIEAYGSTSINILITDLIAECQRSCVVNSKCNVFTYASGAQLCFLYSSANFRSNNNYDSGERSR